MIMQNLKEMSGEKISGDQYIHGSFVKDGTDIHIKSIATFEGFECRLWSPEFHGIMLDSAIYHAKESECLRRKLKYIVGEVDGVKELAETESNTENSFRVIQHSINCVVMSIACLEAWANRIIKNELKGSLKFDRTVKDSLKTVEWGAARIEKDADLLEKLFVVIPLIYGIPAFKEHVTARVRIKELINDRNVLVHMKGNPKINGHVETRRALSLKLLRRDPLLIVKNIIAPIKIIYEKSNKEQPLWLSENIGSLALAEKQAKKS